MKTEKESGSYHGNTSDFPIIDRALAGDQSAYKELFQKHRKGIFRFFMMKTKNNTANSEDLVQDTFVLAFSKLSTFKKNASFYTWLHRIAVNVFLMSCRRKKYFFIPIDELQAGQFMDGELIVEGVPKRDDLPRNGKGNDIGGPDRALENVPNQITVEKLMKGLPPGCKKMLALHDLQGFKYQEVAVIFGCSLRNVKSQRYRAIMKLRAATQTACA